MLIGFVAFVICFERPRDEIDLAVDDDTFIIVGEYLAPCRITKLSTSRVILEDVSNVPDNSDLYVPRIGWVAVTSDRSGSMFHLHPTLEQRRMIVRLLAMAPPRVAETANMRSALIALCRRGFASRETIE
jgi:cellulose synthase (UDP-forming)